MNFGGVRSILNPALRESLRARLRALEIACETAQTDPAEARAALRRIGDSVGRALAGGAAPELEAAALELVSAHKTSTAIRRAQTLIAQLRRALGDDLSRHKVLLVDDDRLLAKVVTDALADSNLEILVARTIAEARRLLGTHEFAVILLDLVLPDGDGRQFLLQLRDTDHLRTPVVVITAKQGAQAMSESLALGADAFLEKPINTDALASLIRKQIRQPDGSVQPAEVPPPRRVLLVEEDELLAQLLQHRFQRDGWEVIHVDNGVSALRLIESERFGVAVLDVHAPGADGFALLRALRQRPERTPVILTSEVGGEDEMQQGFSAGADDYLLKPISPSELIARVQRLNER